MKLLRLLPLLLLLFIAAPAQAQKPIPSLQETSQWKALQTYVGKMQSLQNTPASTVTKQAYTERLQNKETATLNRVQALYKQKINHIKAKDSKKEKKQINKLQAARSSKTGTLRSQRAQALSAARSSYQSKVNSIEVYYDLQIASAKGQLQTLQKNLRRTRNPFQKQVILAHIETVQIKIKNLSKKEKSQLAQAKADWREKSKQLRSRYAKRLSGVQNYYRSLIAEVRRTWQVIYKDDVQAARSNKSKQLSRTRTLAQRGQSYIAAMPTLV